MLMSTRSVIFSLLILIGPHASWVTTAQAKSIAATMYSDGRSCPGGCDAHVVFQKRLNATANAFLPPLGNRTDAGSHRCIIGQPCMICFDQTDASCITVMYRGNGPPDGKFDFTPAFFDEWCPKTQKPDALVTACAVIDRARRSYEARVNCFATPAHASCQGVMAAATTAQQTDEPEYKLCERLGVRAYNRQQADDARDRSTNAGCGYSQNTRKCNSNNVCWQVLLPGACSAGSLVGRDGLDCCTGTISVAGYLHPECTPYYPEN
jgi:hypothetical protein